MTLTCQAQQQITSLSNELGVTEESSTAGEFDDIEDEEECRDQSVEEGENEDGLGDVAQASPTGNMGSFPTDEMSVIEEDNLVDISVEESNLEDDLMEDVDVDVDDFSIANPDEGNNGEEKRMEGSRNSSQPLLIMAPFDKVFNYTNAKYEETTENFEAGEKNIDSGQIKLDNYIRYRNSSSQSQSTKSVLGLFEDFEAGTNSSEVFNASLNIDQAEARSGHNNGYSFASIQKTHMLYGFIYVAILTNNIFS